MNPDIREQLSALIDGELDRDRARFLIKRADHDVELVALWQRWHFVGEAMRGAALPLGRDFARGIAARLENELSADLPETAPSAPPRALAWLRWGGGGALAASVALMALMLVRPGGDLPGDDDVLVPSGQALVDRLASPAVVAPSPYREQDLRPPFRFDAQTVSANEYGRYGGQLRFDPNYEAYWLRHQQAVGERAGASGWAVPLRPEAAQPAE